MAVHIFVLVVIAGFCAVTQAQESSLTRYPGPSPIDPPRCGPVCLIFCEFGNVPDSRGCPTCRCRERPICRPRKCLNVCSNGYVEVNGCPTCTCKPGPICPQKLCRKSCPHGYVVRDGCSTCECKPGPACPVSNCLFIKCAGVIRKRDVNGCETCTCPIRPIDPGCPQVLCQRRCPNGYVYRNGCQTCQCKPGPVCREQYCRRPCPNGYELDSNGCRTCQCKPRNCGPICKIGCPNGLETGPDGCPICKCKPSTSCRQRCLSYCLTRRNRPSGCACSCPRYDRRDGRALP